MVCHGDQGQGLTDEFRALYPPEEQNCWQSGCHGDRPYANGFTLPTTVPAIVGSNAHLDKFADASVLHAFISAAMPWHKPGSLEPEIYWRLTAFLLRQNGVENPYDQLGPDNASFIPIGGANASVSTEDIAAATPHPTAAIDPGLSMQQRLTGQGGTGDGLSTVAYLSLAIVAALIIVFAIVMWRRRMN